MISSLLVLSLCVIAVGGALCVPRATLPAGLYTQAVGSAGVGVAGFAALVNDARAGAVFADALTPRLGVDPLSGAFLGALGLVAAPSMVFAVRYLGRTGRDRAVGVLVAAFLLSLALVLCARDPLTFLTGWEVMTLVPAAVILVARSGDAAARRTVLTYLAVTHLGGVGTWTAVLLLAREGALGHPGVVVPGSALQVTIALAALVGMGTKAGIMPLHVWLPRAHPMAPAPVSALMSGVMIKVAVYALVRVLVEWLGVLPVWVGVVVLGVGALSALGGVVYAIFQHELKRLLALHSIENIGIIVLGLGACLVLRARGDEAWAALALGASLLHTVNHAVFKALLFLGAGAFERAVGTLHLDRMGGLLRAMPVTGAAFLVGAMAIAGLPPLNGFASEWLTLRSLLRLPAVGGVGDGLVGALCLAALAATAALALLCFAKVVGLVLLGPRRDTGPTRAAQEDPSAHPSPQVGPAVPAPVREAAAPMAGAVAFLAVTCVVLGAAPGLLLGPLTALAPFPVPDPMQLPRVGLRLPGSGGLPTATLAVLLCAVVGVLVALRGRRSAAPAPTWACGQLVEPPLNWTSAGFTKPLRLALGGVLRPRREITVVREAGVLQRVTYHGHVPQLIDEKVYRPAVRRSLAVAARARWLQSGSLGMYVAYLIVLVAGLLAAARTGVLR